MTSLPPPLPFSPPPYPAQRTALPPPSGVAVPSWPGILTLVAAVGALIGAALPWTSLTTIFGTLTKNGLEGDGRLSALAGIVMGGLGLAILVARPGHPALAVIAMVAGVGVFIVGVVNAIDVSSRIADIEGTPGVADAQVGVGLWLTVVAGLGGVAGGAGALATRPSPR